MIWTLASIPFWLMGGALTVLGGYGTFAIAWKWRTMPVKETETAMYGAIIILFLAGVALWIAAKVAS